MARTRRLPWSRSELRKPGAVRTYTGRQLDMIAFPLGGIGAGCVSLGGWGQLRDWEIYGCPGKGNLNEMAFFTLYAKPKGGEPVTKVLQGPAGGPRMGPPGLGGGGGQWGRAQGAGLPHFRRCEFTASYPFATVSLGDTTMPLRASLTAWNPFIPLDDRDSSIPCAIFQWTITNPTRRAVDATLFVNLSNTIGFPDCGKGLNRFREAGGIRGLELRTRKHPRTSPRYGTMALATPHRKVTYLNHWLRGGWFDTLTDFWTQVQTGALDESVTPSVSPEGKAEPGTIGLRFSLKAGASRTLPVVLAWHFPTTEMYSGPKGEDGGQPTWKNYCATQWKDAWDVAGYVVGNLKRLESQTRLYDETLRATTMPGQVIEAVSATSAVLKSTTCLRLTGGEFWAWEGCGDSFGCCTGTCTHVWNYQQMLPYLFPALERSIRETDYANNLHEDGSLTFRMPLPLGTPGEAGSHGAADGQLGGIMKVYREWRVSGDDGWLERIWPGVKRALEYAWVRWDRDRDGVMEGVQHNTYDIEFWGPNTMLGSFYLGALRAGEEMARKIGDEEAAGTYRRLFETGKAWSGENLWNGEHFVQRVNLDQDGRAHERPKYQYGSGCLSDQLLGQLFAEMLELGDLYDSRMIDRAAESMFRYNWRADLHDHANVQRIYAQDEEAGLLLCSWPRGGRERFPFPYSDEVWTGIEYSTAALLAYRGLVDEALAIVKAARDRHDGTRRNPWDEFECGHHYARSMSSYAVLLALSGFAADLPRERLAFAPRINERDFATFFSVGSGWGLYSQKLRAAGSEHVLDVRCGSVRIRTLSLPSLGRKRPGKARATLAGRPIRATVVPAGKGLNVVLQRAVTVRRRATLKISLR